MWPCAFRFLAIVLTALAFAPLGAHLMALANKVGLAQQQYFVVQQIYRGWAWSGIVLIGALVADLALMALSRRERFAFVMAGLAAAGMAATLVVFFVWTYPANVATHNWTVAPENWAHLRAQWEYSHAAGAALTFVSLCCAALAGVRGGPRGAAPGGASQTRGTNTAGV